MPQGKTLRVNGYREFMRACAKAEKESRQYVRGTFRSVGDIVKADAIQRLAPLSYRSAAGYRTRVRQRGVAVEQSLRKTTGRRPDWGETQMRNALVPALNENADRVAGEFETAMERVADHFESEP